MASETSLETPNASEFSYTLDSENENTGIVVRPLLHPTGRIPTSQGQQCFHLKCRLGRSLKSILHWRLMVYQEKGLHIKLLELKAMILALRHFQEKCDQNQVLVASDNSMVVAYINKQGGTHSVGLCGDC